MTISKGDGSVDPSRVLRLMQQISAAATNHADAMEPINEARDALCKKHRVNKKAFSWAAQLYRMEPEVASDVLRSLDNLRHLLGFDDQLDLLDPVPGAVAAEQGEPAGAMH